MPPFLEKKLKTEAAAQGMTGKQADRYVYGGMNNLGAMSGNKETPKGAVMQAKHTRDVKAKTASGMPTHHGKNLGHFLHPKRSR